MNNVLHRKEDAKGDYYKGSYTCVCCNDKCKTIREEYEGENDIRGGFSRVAKMTTAEKDKNDYTLSQNWMYDIIQEERIIMP